MKSAVVVSTLLALLLLKAVVAQPAAGPAFEVTSIKLDNSGGNYVEVLPGTVHAHSATLATCITWAWGVADIQLTGSDTVASGLLNSDRWDIVAKATSAVPEGQLKIMLQTLLAERFKLALHRQRREIQTYALVLEKSAKKLRESKSEGEREQQMKSRLDRQWLRTTMTQFAADLSGAMQAPVQDQTGLSGKYDLALDLTPFLPASGERPDIAAMMVTAIKEQLGLQLESRRAPGEVLVIDHLEKPAAN